MFLKKIFNSRRLVMHNYKSLKLTILVLFLAFITVFAGCFTAPPIKVGNIEGYVYVPESSTKGMPIILRNLQVPAGYIPLVGAEVNVDTSSKSTTTDNNGYFILSSLPIGHTILTIVPLAGSGYQTLTTDVNVSENTTVSLGNYGAVTLPSEGADHWDVVINKIDITNWPEVKIYVQVIDPVNNSPIIGATAENFHVDIDGIDVGPLQVSQLGGILSSPSSSCLVMDRSGSMWGQPLTDAKAAAKTFVGFMASSDRAEVVSFASGVTVDQPFTSDKQALYNAIDSLYSSGMTALYDGIWQGLDNTALETNDRKAVIALTDGMENDSSSVHGGGYPPDNSLLIAHAQQLNIPVYTISLGLKNREGEALEGIEVTRINTPEEDLQQIADETGGEFFNAPTSSDLEHIYVQITQRIQQQYILTFNDNTGVSAGTLTVKVDYSGINGETNTLYHGSKEWTVMIYLDADNNLESAGIDDINEMEIVGSTSEVNIVVQVDRVPYSILNANNQGSFDDTSNSDWTTTRRYYITQDFDSVQINSQLISDLGELNMGDPQTLVDFANWAVANYPAQEYLLVIWNHGGGFRYPGLTKDIAWDDTDGKDKITIPELENALSAISTQMGKNIDIVGMDACLMAMTEVAYQIKDYADILVASEETEPFDGWPYDTILEQLVSNPTMAPNQLATNIVDSYILSYTASDNVTQSSVDLSYMDTLASQLSNLATAIISDSITPLNNYIIASNSCQDYYYNDFIDLYDFCNKISIYSNNTNVKNIALTIQQTLNSAILHNNYIGSNVNGSRGLSIYFPEPNTYYDTYYDNTNFSQDTSWDEMLSHLGY